MCIRDRCDRLAVCYRISSTSHGLSVHPGVEGSQPRHQTHCISRTSSFLVGCHSHHSFHGDVKFPHQRLQSCLPKHGQG
eukprot:10497506-Alexandrium_andersonii.AAC.1